MVPRDDVGIVPYDPVVIPFVGADDIRPYGETCEFMQMVAMGM